MTRTQKIIDLLLARLGLMVVVERCPFEEGGACRDGKLADGGNCFACDGIGRKLSLQSIEELKNVQEA